MDNAERLIQITVDNGEARVAGVDGDAQEVVNSVIGLQRNNGRPWCHELISIRFAKLERTIEHLGFGLIKLALISGVSHQSAELLRGAGRRELVGWFNAELSY